MKHSFRWLLRFLSAVICLSVIFALAVPAFAVPVIALPALGVDSLSNDLFRAEPRIPRGEMPILRSTAAVHRYADPNSSVIGQLVGGTAVTVLDTQGAYYKIDCYDMVGYLRKDLVSYTQGVYRVKCNFTGPDTGILTGRPLGELVMTRSAMYNTATAQVGVPYRMGGTTPNGFDCSGFTQYVYRQHGIAIPRTCEMQLAEGVIIPKESLQCGDLVLFHRTNHPTALVTHVGMYLGDGKLIHAGSAGITVVELDSRYFAEHYLCARRILIPSENQLQHLATTLARILPG